LNLIIDIGNSRAKVGIFDKQSIVAKETFEYLTIDDIINISEKYPIKNAIISASGLVESNLISYLNDHFNFIDLNYNTPLPIIIEYQTPETLGKDRIASAVAAWTIFPKQTSLVIDMGTCMTTNLIDKKGNFLGGNISPGIQMRIKAMYHFTAKLPLAPLNIPEHELGKNTIEALQNGAIKGTFYEIKAFITEINQKYQINNVILTGGDADLFAKLVNFEIFAVPNLVMMGLNEILQNNV